MTSRARVPFALLLGTATLLGLPLSGFADEPVAAPSATPAVTPAAAPIAAALECNDCPPPWTGKIIPYGWLPGLHGDLTVRGVTAPVSISIGKTLDLILDDLDFMFLGQVEATNGKVGIIFNSVYLKLGLDNEIRRLDFSSYYAQTILDGVVTYQLDGMPALLRLPCGSRFEALAGVRYNAISGGVTVTGPLGNTATAAGTEDWFDPIVGFRVQAPLGERATVQLRADVGGFGISGCSRFTWNVEAMLEYCLSERCSLTAGYRALDIDYTNGSGNQRFSYDINLNGPVVGIAFKF